jgi:hypothetical protein
MLSSGSGPQPCASARRQVPFCLYNVLFDGFVIGTAGIAVVPSQRAQFGRVIASADLQHSTSVTIADTARGGWLTARPLRYDAPSAPEVECETSEDGHNQEAEAPEGGDVGQAVPGRRSFSFQEGPERVQGAPTDHGNGVDDDTRDDGACYHADGGNIVRQ